MNLTPWPLGTLALLGYAALLTWKARGAFAYIRDEGRPIGAESPPVEPYELTILQPILSGDPTLEATLAANLAAREVGTTFAWLVDDDDVEGQRIARKLQGPGVSVVSYPAAEPGVNPKTAKLERAFADVSTEFVAVLDDDTTVGADHLRWAVQTLRRTSCEEGIYTGLPTYCTNRDPLSPGDRASRGGRIGAALIAAFVNSSSALTYLPAAHSAPPITLNGMFYVTRSSVLRSIGGFAAIRAELCDDLALAQLYQRADRPIHQGSMAQLLSTGGMGLASYAKRMHRWFVFAKVLVGRASRRQRIQLGIKLGAPPMLLWVGVLCAIFSWPVALLLATVLGARHAVLLTLLRATREPRAGAGPSARLHPVGSPLSELLLPFHALHAALRPTIQWRTRRMRVRRDGSFASLPEKP